MRIIYYGVMLICLTMAFGLDADVLAKKSKHNVWNVKIHFTVGVDNYSGDKKAKINNWIATQVKEAERLFSAKPKLKIKTKIIRKTKVGNRNLSSLHFEDVKEYVRFMDKYFDNVARTKTSGYLQVLIVDNICIGWEINESTGKREPRCIGGRATFPHWVSPFNRKHGITINYPDDRDWLLAHELGQAGFDWVCAHATWKKRVEQILETARAFI